MKKAKAKFNCSREINHMWTESEGKGQKRSFKVSRHQGFEEPRFRSLEALWLTEVFQHIMHKLNMKHEKHPWFIRDSNPVPLGQKSGALTTELPGQE
jgi:hypothetical protein